MTPKTADETDVIVIGAGVAGLAAAVRLSRERRKVVVLEARDRIGGRIWSECPAGWPVPVALGAEFVHGGNRAFETWMRRAGLSPVPAATKHWFATNGRRVPLPEAWERIDAVMRRIGPRFRGSFSAWMKRCGDEVAAVDRVLVRKFVEGFHGAPLDEMSGRSLFQATQQDEQQGRLPGGYGPLIETLRGELRAGAEIRLGTIVSSVRWRRGDVVIEAEGRAWRARAALVTVPLGVLQATVGETGAIRFEPALTQKMRGWQRLGCGHAIRVVLRMRADVWRRGPLPPELRGRDGREFGFLHSNEPVFPVWWSEAPAPVLVGWTGGPPAAAMAERTPTQIYRAARRTLARLLGCSDAQLARAVVAWRTHDWTGDPFTRGAYSFSMAGRENVPRRLGTPVRGTLYFAGEATADPLELGTVHGALASGERAADEILRQVRTRETAE